MILSQKYFFKKGKKSVKYKGARRKNCCVKLKNKI